MSEEKIPINEFRAKTAEVLRTIKETGAVYTITSHGEPVADIVPYGTAVRKKGKSLLGIYEKDFDPNIANIPLQEQINWTKQMWNMPDDEWVAGWQRLYKKYNPAAE